MMSGGRIEIVWSFGKRVWLAILVFEGTYFDMNRSYGCNRYLFSFEAVV